MKPLDSNSAIAKASPNASADVVEDVGARSRGHASLDLITIDISDAKAIEDLLLLVRDASLYEDLFSEGRILIISSVSPELDIKKTISFCLSNPYLHEQPLLDE